MAAVIAGWVVLAIIGLLCYAHGKLDHQLRVGRWWLAQLKQSEGWLAEIYAEGERDDPDFQRMANLMAKVETLNALCASYGDDPVDRFPFERTREQWAAWRARRRAIREVLR